MRAKLVKKIPQREGLSYYFREFEFECIDCGAHYFRKRCDARTSPYCSACQRKHDKEKQDERKVRKERELIVSAIDDIRAEIDNALSDGMIHKKTVLGIIDKYKARGGCEG